MKIKNRKLSILALTLLLGGCASPPPPPALTPMSPPSAHSATPDLSAYVRFELYAQNAGLSGRPLGGSLKFKPEGARIDAFLLDGSEIGRLHLQPDSCRDDPNPGCERRFLANGRLQALGANLSCAVPVRNDVNVGYQGQTLSGLCQSQFGRAYTLQLFPR
jgi:hypothetical protein